MQETFLSQVRRGFLHGKGEQRAEFERGVKENGKFRSEKPLTIGLKQFSTSENQGKSAAFDCHTPF